MHFIPLFGEQIYNFIRKINEIGYKFLFYLWQITKILYDSTKFNTTRSRIAIGIL